MFEVILLVLVLFGITILEGVSAGPGLAGMFAAAAFLAASLVLLLKKRRTDAAGFAVKAGICAAAVLLLFVFGKSNAARGRKGAERIAAACEEYKARNGAYPDSLAQLAPGYIDRVPAAKVSLRWSQYWLRDGKVMFAGEPGMYMVTYDLAAKKFGHIPAGRM